VTRTRILFLTAIFLCSSAARAQQAETHGEHSRAEQSNSGAPAQKATERHAWRGGDLAADNLERVAATAEQISEVLNRDPRLMVELKRALAQDAGASGQLLEESDLSDAAIAERLRDELRTRVLATRLLQRYGYLLPKPNPDSEAAQEQRALTQVRVQALARAAERSSEARESSAERAAACHSNATSGCEWPDGAAQPAGGRSNGRGTNNSPASQEPQGDETAPATRPENWNSPGLQRAEATEPGSAETLLASASPMSAEGNLSPSRSAARSSPEGTLPPMLGASDDPWGRSTARERSASAGAMSRGTLYRAIPGPACCRNLLPAVPPVVRGGRSRSCGVHRTLARGRRMGWPWRAETGALDVRTPEATQRSGADRRRRGV
jgi:hypothetical protein